MEEQEARARLRAANGPWLTEDILARLAPQVVELSAALASLEEQLAPEIEPATVQRVTSTEA